MPETPLVMYDPIELKTMSQSNIKLRPDLSICFNNKTTILVELKVLVYNTSQLEKLMKYFMALAELLYSSIKTHGISQDLKYLRFFHIVLFSIDISDTIRQNLLIGNLPKISDTLVVLNAVNDWADLPKSSTTYKAFSFIEANKSQTEAKIEENFFREINNIEKLGQKFYFHKLVVLYRVRK
ncbi:MAG: hypothetical protein ACTSVC_11410 [Promethearchaeota archaeon]